MKNVVEKEPTFSFDRRRNSVGTPIPADLQRDPWSMATEPDFHSPMVLAHWDKLVGIITSDRQEFAIDGETLDVATIVAVARYGASVRLGRRACPNVEGSAEFLASCLDAGVNTGFGGSADTRTDETKKLQRTLISFLNCGILAPEALPIRNGTNRSSHAHSVHSHLISALPNEDPMAATFMPEPWVRASLLVRSNSLIMGNSGVRSELVKSLAELLRNDITPIIPLRGSISASGDLIPLSYVAGALQGSSGINVWIRERNLGVETRSVVSADVALSQSALSPLKLQPKEGLAIVNGTAVSCGVGALAIHDAHCLIVLSQVLTAMGVEAIRGDSESFDPFLAEVRPHVGQVEASRNIKHFLTESKLASHGGSDHIDDGSLRQDRYSTRTASQWIGPQLEDLTLAHRQLTVESNSTTDNPIIDTPGRRVLHGGNFQAMAVTSAMEKVRPALQIIGRMLFAQCTELINPALSNGLPPNLDADEPSQSFLMKGVDISIAALQAELGFLANPVVSHVQTAEMGNQSLNSLALVSARYTHMALDVLSQLSAAYLYALCQALDLRVLHLRFLETLKPGFEAITDTTFGPVLSELDRLLAALWLHLQRELHASTKMDSAKRFEHVIESLQPTILSFAATNCQDDALLVPALRQWIRECTTFSLHAFRTSREHYLAHPDPVGFLGPASTRMYTFVRQELQVPFQNGKAPEKQEKDTPVVDFPVIDAHSATTGSWVSKIYSAIRNGTLFVPVMECLREVRVDGHERWIWKDLKLD
ncbi:hypothetical protein MMC13_004982 [Lambiella insularis]|nr:hypothetical protein [Lambiella insularis]